MDPSLGLIHCRFHSNGSQWIDYCTTINSYTNFLWEVIETTVTSDAERVRSWIEATDGQLLEINRPVVGFGVHCISWGDGTREAITLQLCTEGRCIAICLALMAELPAVLREFVRNPRYTFYAYSAMEMADLLRESEHQILMGSTPRSLQLDEFDPLWGAPLCGFTGCLCGPFVANNMESDRRIPHPDGDQVLLATQLAYLSYEIGTGREHEQLAAEGNQQGRGGGRGGGRAGRAGRP